MDLSFLKWPIIIAVVVLIGWLLSSSGVNYMYNKFTATPPGQDAKADVRNEEGLSRLGGYCLKLWKYEKAMNIFQTAITRYPTGKNVLYNRYRMVKCAEKLGNYAAAADILKELIAIDAGKSNPNVPNNDVLRLRREKLVETHELEKR